MSQSPSAFLVESIPTGMDDLRTTEGVRYTEDVLRELTDAAEESIDFTVMYWSLFPDRSEQGDERGFSDEELDALGAGHGRDLFESLRRAAADRNVRLRIVQNRGDDEGEDPEVQRLVEGCEERVLHHDVKMSAWYGSGIMHQKIWIFDRKTVYIGSANMDWKSLSQVKEIGIVLRDMPDVAEEVGRYFDAWWQFAGMHADEWLLRRNVFDPRFQIIRKLPAWSELVDDPIESPFSAPALRTAYNWDHPMPLRVGGREAGMFLSGAPVELCTPARTSDEDALVKTILDAEQSVCISVMDFAPVSLYRGEYDKSRQSYVIDGEVASPVWWPALFDALLHVVMTKKVHARLLISKWAHSSHFIDPFLKALDAAARAATTPHTGMIAGKLEIRHFVVPGHDRTEPPKRDFPGHTRVNHTKYIVTDRRANIGTSNMTWDYFACTAGTSFNTDHRDLVEKLQEIFDRDWSSKYARDKVPAGSSHCPAAKSES